VHGVITAIRTASKLMGDGGRIVTIGSGIATRASFPGLADYAATKGCNRRLLQGRIARPRTARITVNVLQPGSINTDMNPDDDREFADAQRTQHALQRFGTAEEIASRRRVPHQPAGLVRDWHGAQCRWRLRRVTETTRCKTRRAAPGASRKTQ